MAKRKHTAEEIINKLREAEVVISSGSTVAETARRIGGHIGSPFPFGVCIIHPVEIRRMIRSPSRAGWDHRNTRGSHRHFTHHEKPGWITAKHSSGEITVGAHRICLARQLGIVRTLKLFPIVNHKYPASEYGMTAKERDGWSPYNLVVTPDQLQG